MSPSDLDRATLAAIVASCESAARLTTNADIEGAANALARADKLFQDLARSHPPHARVRRQAQQVIQKALAASMSKDPGRRLRLGAATARACQRILEQ